MKEATLLVSLLLTANTALAEVAYPNGLPASEIVREGEIVAVEFKERDWHLLVDYDDTLYACETIRGFKDGMGIYCLPLPYEKE